jgi:thiamine-phosphate pyrophosphorylase
MKLVFPRLYVIMDADLLRAPLLTVADVLAGAGVELIQYRNKQASSRALFEAAAQLSAFARPRGMKLIINDRADVAALSGAGGVHVGQDDLSAAEAQRIVGLGSWVGISTHNLEQFRAAAETCADYIALGPIFSTRTKRNPDPVVGAELLRQARPLTTKPLVAIGGITAERAAEVYAAGADCAAVASDVLSASNTAARVRQYLEAAHTAGHN